MHSDSAREFRRKQQRWSRRGGLKTQAGKAKRPFQVSTNTVGKRSEPKLLCCRIPRRQLGPVPSVLPSGHRRALSLL